MCLNLSLSEILHVNNAADIDDLNLSSHGFGNSSLKNYFYYLLNFQITRNKDEYVPR